MSRLTPYLLINNISAPFIYIFLQHPTHEKQVYLNPEFNQLVINDVTLISYLVVYVSIAQLSAGAFYPDYK